MNNIAFTTLVILILAVPGFIFRASYLSGPFTRQVLPANITDDIARGILWSLPFHAIGMYASACLQHTGVIQTTLNFETLARILSGIYRSEGEGFTDIIDRLYRNSTYITLYYLSVLLAALALGHASRKLVWSFKLDVHIPWLLRFRNPWIYDLMGRDVPAPYKGAQVFAYIDALTNIAIDGQEGKTRLYRGIVAGFTTEENGALRDIYLTEAQRGNFREDEGKKIFEWRPVAPGNLFVLKYSELKNLNITYASPLPLNSTSPKTPDPDDRTPSPA
jgi:hypothetical protein